MKCLFVVLILISNVTLAGTTNEILKNLPKKVVEMISEYPQALQLQMDCFGYPTINIDACKEVANINHQGSMYAKHNLGFTYQNGLNGLHQSYSEAFFWYLKASNQGLANSSYNLGRMYEYGLGMQTSHVMARSLYIKTMAQEDTGPAAAKEAFERLGVLTLLAMNQKVEQGSMDEEVRFKFAKMLKPWQVDEANTYFD
ncbi:hypothetical protein OAI28_05900 [Methylophilaceae bacterium]|jgi:TPR repeat protein|nr:hypothetical protein [Methylophilaceae bacterium]|tara:strand:- start:633 stop:1229 length:597 start_codon:yes stop_codon:yes gene_type:complete